MCAFTPSLLQIQLVVLIIGLRWCIACPTIYWMCSGDFQLNTICVLHNLHGIWHWLVLHFLFFVSSAVLTSARSLNANGYLWHISMWVCLRSWTASQPPNQGNWQSNWEETHTLCVLFIAMVGYCSAQPLDILIDFFFIGIIYYIYVVGAWQAEEQMQASLRHLNQDFLSSMS